MASRKYPPKHFLTCEEAAELIMAEDSDIEDLEEANVPTAGDVVENLLEQHPEVQIVQPTSTIHDLAEIVMNYDDIALVQEDDYDVESSVELIDAKYSITQKKDIKWRNRQFDGSPFEFNSIETYSSDSIETPFEIFSRYIPFDLYEQMAQFTNTYALQNGSTNFKHATPKEVMSLFGMHLIMGVLGFPQIAMYWNSHIELQAISKVMTRDRFYWLRSHLHLVDNCKIPKQCKDKFYKVRPIIDSVRKRCNEMPMERSLSIDEQTIPFKGHLSIKQYVKGKPSPWGLKVFLLCGKTGYPYDFVLYQGNTTEIDLIDRTNLGFGAAVIKHLIQRVSAEGHNLFFDNYFSTFQIFEILSSNKINAAGTIRVNRFNSPCFSTDATMKKKGRGTSEEITSRDGNIVLVKWQDNRAVHLASNFIGKGTECIVDRWDKNVKSYVKIKQPEIVSRYNECMGGVDLVDQYMSYYRIFIKSRKWTLRVIFHFVDLAVCASYLEYKQNCDFHKLPKRDILSLKDFKLKLGWCLTKIDAFQSNNCKRKRTFSEANLEQPGPNVRPTEHRPEKDVRFDRVDHLPQFQASHSAFRCKNPGCKGRSRIVCVKCQVHLCVNANNNCFYDFHNK